MKKHERTDEQKSSGHIFLVRLWPEEGTDGGASWHGKVQNIVHGEASNFADLPALIDCLFALLPSQDEGMNKPLALKEPLVLSEANGEAGARSVSEEKRE